MDNNYEEQIIARISECSIVVDRLNNDPAWNILLRDFSLLVQQIDDSWQEIDDEKKLEKARVYKHAIKHLMNTKKNYEEELEAAKEALNKMQSPETEIVKDYDSETKLEGNNG